MATYTKLLLSASNNGSQTGINQSTPPGVTLHTAVSGTSSIDEVWLRATNNGTSTLPLTVCWGGTNPADIMVVNLLPGTGPNLVVDGHLIQNGIIISAYAAGVYSTCIVMSGNVNRIS